MVVESSEDDIPAKQRSPVRLEPTEGEEDGKHLKRKDMGEAENEGDEGDKHRKANKAKGSFSDMCTGMRDKGAQELLQAAGFDEATAEEMLQQVAKEKLGDDIGKLGTVADHSADAGAGGSSAVEERTLREGVSMCPAEVEMWQTLAKADFRFSTSGAGGNLWAGRFDRYLQSCPEKAAEYKELKGNVAKSEFRARWARSRYDQAFTEGVHSEAISKTDKNDGEHLSLARIAQLEGGCTPDWKAAVSYALRAIGVGGPWVKYDSWAGKLKFLYMVSGVSERHTEKWEEKTKYRNNKPGDSSEPAASSLGRSSGASGVEIQAQTAPKEKPALEHKPGTPAETAPKGQGKGKGKERTEDEQLPPKGKGKGAKGKAKGKPGEGDEMAQVVIEAKCLRQQYGVSSAEAQTILLSIAQDPLWDWATGEKFTVPLEQSVKDISDVLGSNPMLRTLMTTDWAVVKKEGSVDFNTSLKTFVTSLQSPIKHLSKKCTSLLKQHRVVMEEISSPGRESRASRA